MGSRAGNDSVADVRELVRDLRCRSQAKLEALREAHAVDGISASSTSSLLATRLVELKELRAEMRQVMSNRVRLNSPRSPLEPQNVSGRNSNASSPAPPDLSE